MDDNEDEEENHTDNRPSWRRRIQSFVTTRKGILLRKTSTTGIPIRTAAATAAVVWASAGGRSQVAHAAAVKTVPPPAAVKVEETTNAAQTGATILVAAGAGSLLGRAVIQKIRTSNNNDDDDDDDKKKQFKDIMGTSSTGSGAAITPSKQVEQMVAAAQETEAKAKVLAAERAVQAKAELQAKLDAERIVKEAKSAASKPKTNHPLPPPPHFHPRLQL
jgi:hypothetical protein